MTYTPNQPTEPGYYWVTLEYDQIECIIEVVSTGPNQLEAYHFGDEDPYTLDGIGALLWSGPIVRPGNP